MSSLNGDFLNIQKAFPKHTEIIYKTIYSAFQTFGWTKDSNSIISAAMLACIELMNKKPEFKNNPKGFFRELRYDTIDILRIENKFYSTRRRYYTTLSLDKEIESMDKDKSAEFISPYAIPASINWERIRLILSNRRHFAIFEMLYLEYSREEIASVLSLSKPRISQLINEIGYILIQDQSWIINVNNFEIPNSMADSRPSSHNYKPMDLTNKQIRELRKKYKLFT